MSKLQLLSENNNNKKKAPLKIEFRKNENEAELKHTAVCM